MHPAVFFGGAVLLCASWLWVRSIRDAEAPADFGAAGTQTQPARDEIDVGVEILERYVGRYRIDANVSVDVTLEGDRLYALATGLPKYGLIARSETEFLVADIDAELEFVANLSGEFTRFVVLTSDRRFTANRVD
jgi:hypothetical protein